MSLTTSPSTNGRCGMCGSCGAMPPWAPEMLKNTSPEARRALERRMRQAQTRFIEQRDAKRKANQITQHECTDAETHHLSPDSLREDEVHLTPSRQQRPPKPADSINQFSAEPQTEPTAPRDFHPSNNSALPTSKIHVEDDATVDIPLDSVGLPPLPPSDDTSPQVETSNLHPDEPLVLQLPRRKLPQFSSPALQESPAPPETPELQALSDISLEPNQLSEPLRTISLRDADSDADSFHTAEGDELLRRSSDRLSLPEDEETDDNVAPIVSETQWQALQDDEVFSVPKLSAPDVSESAPSETAISSVDEDVSLEGHTTDLAHPDSASPKTESVAPEPNENLEASVIMERSVPHGPSSPHAKRDALMDDYALPADLIRPNEIDLAPQPCQDCERWRERVRELELKVEALTSALNAREMESASMRARAVDRRFHGKNEAQLMQECESLRITTEYLYYKLERYERKFNGSHPDVH